MMGGQGIVVKIEVAMQSRNMAVFMWDMRSRTE